MILPAAVREFRLQKKIGPYNDARPIRRCQPFPDTRFEVMTPLVRGINPAKPRSEREFGQRWSTILLPGSAVEKTR